MILPIKRSTNDFEIVEFFDLRYCCMKSPSGILCIILIGLLLL